MPSDFAPGLPEKGKTHPIRQVSQRKWPLGVQLHAADRAGKHFDLRIGDPETGHAHSWAMRKWPGPGESALAVRQGTHTIPYMSFKGTIPAGVYGAGKVERHRLEDVEIVSANPDKIVFNAYPGRDTEEYALVKTDGNQWLLINKTPTRGKDIPEAKPKYKQKDPEAVVFSGPEILQEKVDGAHVVSVLKKNQPIRVFSYRPSQRSPLPINHTDRIEGMRYTKAPSALDNTIVRGEILAVGKGGKALPAHELGGLLNSSVWKSRAEQARKGARLESYIFDVVKYHGKNMENAPYEEKLKVLERVRAALPKTFKLPKTAFTEGQKKKLFDAIRSGKNPSTKEGVILWNPDKSVPTKVKFRPDFDVRIKDVFTKPKSQARGEAGGIVYDQVDGKAVKPSRVGTGFSQAMRKALLAHPEAYKGLVLKVRAMEQHSSGALRAPASLGLHIDRNPTDTMPKVIN